MRGRSAGSLALAAAGAAILLVALWLRNPLIPYGGASPRASGNSPDSSLDREALARRRDAIRSIAAAVAAEQSRLARIASGALAAPTDPKGAFDYLKELTESLELGVLVIDSGVPFAWAGQLRTTPVRSGQGTTVIFSPFYTSLQVELERQGRVTIATALIHAEPPAEHIANALDEQVEARAMVESFRFAPPTDTAAPDVIRGSGGNPLMRVDAVPLSAEVLAFRESTAAQGRGTIVFALAILFLLAVAWSERRSLPRRLFAIAVALAAIAIVPWNNFSNFSRAFDPAYFFSPLAGPLTANAGVFAMFASLLVLGVIACIRARRTRLNRGVAVIGATTLLIGGVAIAELAAEGIALPHWGSTPSLWLTWETPLFLLIFAFWLAAAWLGRGATRGAPMLQLRAAAIIAVLAGSVATFVVWTKTTEQRLQLAMRDVAGLQRPDTDATPFLRRFGEQLATYDSAGTRADVLKRYAVSDLAPAELQVSLGTWRKDGSPAARLDLAQLPFDSATLAQVVREAIDSGESIVRQTLGPTGRQVMLAVRHRDSSATSAVASPRTRLVALDPYAALLGFDQPDRTEPPYTLTLAEVTPGGTARAGAMTWRRLGNEWHGDQLVATSQGNSRAHVEVDLRSWPTRLVRASLIVILDVAVAGILWALGAMAEGGFFRWLRGRASRWVRSYSGRLTLVLFTFFVVPAIAFATWSYQRLRGDDRGVRELLVRETLQAAAREDSTGPQLFHARDETPLFLYSRSVLTTASDSLYEIIAPAGRMLPRPVQLSIAGDGELTASWQQTLAGSRVFWGFRDASRPAHQSYVLAAPARSDELVLDRRRRDLTLLVLFATALGAIAAFWLSGIAARILARDLELARIEVARAERVLAWGEMARQIAHEIKNPLTPIRLGVQHLRRARNDPRIDFDRVLAENVTRILSEIDRLDEIARAFSRYGSAPGELPPAERVDVALILRDVVGLERMGIGEVSWSLEGGDDPSFAEARTDELRDVLLNLFENARLARARNVRVQLSTSDGSVVIEIVDDGAGISRAALPRVFEPHFSTRTTGSGLGLAISRRLLESWGGTIGLESEEGSGAHVVITLRAADA